jgi:TRAP-type C4-dicarboxylate transport system permease small subunit
LISEIFSRAVTVGFLLLVGAAGWVGAVERMERSQTAPASGIPIWPTRFLIPLGVAIYVFLVVALPLSGRRGGEPDELAGLTDAEGTDG